MLQNVFKDMVMAHTNFNAFQGKKKNLIVTLEISFACLIIFIISFSIAFYLSNNSKFCNPYVKKYLEIDEENKDLKYKLSYLKDQIETLSTELNNLKSGREISYDDSILVNASSKKQNISKSNFSQKNSSEPSQKLTQNKPVKNATNSLDEKPKKQANAGDKFEVSNSQNKDVVAKIDEPKDIENNEMETEN